jgi:type I restriction enzyme R subunit
MQESQVRKEIIDKELLNSGWNTDDITKVSKEYLIEIDNNLPDFFDKNKNYADYVLLNKKGKIIAIVEAKKSDKSVGSAKSQAEYYARKIKAKQGFTPFIYTANGYEIDFWDSENGVPRKVLSYHSLSDLETYRKRKEKNIVLSAELLNKDIAGRTYQIEAITKTIARLNENHRSFLWVMATGTGKTRTIIALTDILLRAGFIKRVLFLADRKALVGQAIGSFNDYYLPDQVRQIKSKTFSKDAKIYASTYQTMTSIIKNADVSQGFFDLIIADESHRSIYNYYGQAFLKFDALKIGLTATPVDFIDRDTYQFFGAEKGNPTFAYTYEEALRDKFLSPYEVLSVQTNFQDKGIKFDDLEKQEQEKLKNSGYGEEEIDFEGSAIEKIVINDDTNRQILTTFMNECYKHPATNLPAKTIIFAISKKHAYRLEQLFNELFPQYSAKLAKVIVSELNNAEDLIKEFKNENSGFNIAISVDMLDTGIDVPSIMSLVFAKPVFSKAKFWQMIGRGTRLYNEDFDKDKFCIFDFWQNFENFNENPDGLESKEQISLNRKIFDENLKLLENLTGDEFITIKDEIKQQIASLPKDDYFIKSNAKLLSGIDDDFYKNLGKDNLGANLPTLNQISKLLDRLEVNEPSELQFRAKVKKLQNFKIEQNANKIEKLINSILEDVERVKINKTLTIIQDNLEVLEKCSDGNYWATMDFDTTNAVVNIIAPLMQYKSKTSIEVQHFDFEDFIFSTKQITINHNSIELDNYQQNTLTNLQNIINNSHALQKLFLNETLTKQDIKDLKNDFADNDLKTDKLKEIFNINDSKSADFVAIVKQIASHKEYKIPFLLDNFIQSHSLSESQIEFIKAIKNFVIEKRDIERKDLTNNPFTRFHKQGIIGVFANSQLKELVKIIDDENDKGIG